MSLKRSTLMAMDRKKHAPTTVTEQLRRIQGLEGFYHGKFVKEDGNMLHFATGSNVSSSTNCLSYGCELHGEYLRIRNFFRFWVGTRCLNVPFSSTDSDWQRIYKGNLDLKVLAYPGLAPSDLKGYQNKIILKLH